MQESEAPVASLLMRVLNPFIVFTTLVGLTVFSTTPFDGYYLLLAIIASFVSARVYDRMGLDRCWPRSSLTLHVRDVVVGWTTVVGIVLLLGFVTKFSAIYARSIILPWFVITPVLILLGHMLLNGYLLHRARGEGQARTAVIVGITEHSLKFAEKINQDPYLNIKVEGFFEDRGEGRKPELPNALELGGLAELAAYARDKKVNIIYIALPMFASPRLLSLIDELQDTTVSVYFLPDLFMFDLMHARFGQIHGVPVVAIRDTPLIGSHSINKQVSDTALGFLFLLLLAPLMLLIAVGVKLTSAGPVLFKQRRYGVDGEEIVVYKFRTMTVCEDGDSVRQATQNDARVTRFGAFLRRTSLDELPQFINVIQGRMSIVGPRPHAVAHNEMYRKLIKGYMVRHKVKPGITGWAQVHGLRGETETIDKMQKRVDYDLEYIRTWSLGLDFLIILRTAAMVLKRKNAY